MRFFLNIKFKLFEDCGKYLTRLKALIVAAVSKKRLEGDLTAEMFSTTFLLHLAEKKNELQQLETEGIRL